MPKLNLPKAPETQVQWGIITDECKENFKNWIEQLVVLASIHPNAQSQIVDTLYEELTSLGYSEGYDDYAASHDDGDGW